MKFVFLVIFGIFSTSFACNNGEYPIGNGEIFSPNFPNFYDNKLECQYVLHANEEIPYAVVNLTFDVFEVEGCCDWLAIYDGPDVLSTKLQTLNGTLNRTRSFHSTQPYMTLRFFTNLKGTMAGFSAKYETISYERNVCPKSYYTLNHGEVSSPNYLRNYSNNHDCTYLLATNLAGRQLQITFDHFGTEQLHDQLILYDGASTTAPIITTLSGHPEMPLSYVSTGTMLFLRFKTDSSETDRGFHATYSLLTETRSSILDDLLSKSKTA